MKVASLLLRHCSIQYLPTTIVVFSSLFPKRVFSTVAACFVPCLRQFRSLLLCLFQKVEMGARLYVCEEVSVYVCEFVRVSFCLRVTRQLQVYEPVQSAFICVPGCPFYLLLHVCACFFLFHCMPGDACRCVFPPAFSEASLTWTCSRIYPKTFSYQRSHSLSASSTSGLPSRSRTRCVCARWCGCVCLCSNVRVCEYVCLHVHMHLTAY